MPDTIVQVTLRTADSLPANYVTNQLCIANMASGDLTEAAVTTAIKDFYDTFRAACYPSTVAQNDHICKFYTAGGPQPNYPYAETTWDFATAPAGTPLPSECAIVLSFQGLRIPGTPQARRRGRIYIGPLVSTANNAGRPATAAATNPTVAAVTFAADIQAIDASYRWAVWSALNGSAVPVANGWVDDAFDTQRSRGVQTTSRITFSV